MEIIPTILDELKSYNFYLYSQWFIAFAIPTAVALMIKSMQLFITSAVVPDSWHAGVIVIIGSTIMFFLNFAFVICPYSSTVHHEQFYITLSWASMALINMGASFIWIPNVVLVILLSLATISNTIAILVCQPVKCSMLFRGEGIEHMALIVWESERCFDWRRWKWRSGTDEGRIRLF